METNYRKQKLLQKYLNDECSRAELEELFNFLKSGEDGSYREVMDDLWNRISTEKILEKGKADRVLKQAIKTNKVKPFRWYYAAAAVLALVIAAGSIYLFSYKKEQTRTIVKQIPERYKNDIKPGGTKAILQAGNVQVTLGKKDTSFTLAGNTVNINSGKIEVAEVKPVQYTLTTPRGGEYSLVLPDGTKVWLNAASELIYPSVFTGRAREVSLTGEAYFEVQQDAGHPFIVHTKEQDITVLGTAFNVHAYPKEKAAVTTLVSGKVRVNSFGERMVLEPGQQVILPFDKRRAGQAQEMRLVKNADVEQAIAWKKGYFRFDNTDLHEIMRRLSRWYDVEVKYAEGIQSREFMAIISRDNNISQVLGMLEATGAVHFKIEGKVVTAMK